MAKEGQRLEGTTAKWWMSGMAETEKMQEWEHERREKRNGRPKKTSTARWLPRFLTPQHAMLRRSYVE